MPGGRVLVNPAMFGGLRSAGTLWNEHALTPDSFYGFRLLVSPQIAVVAFGSASDKDSSIPVHSGLGDE